LSVIVVFNGNEEDCVFANPITTCVVISIPHI
jgi:hypothetical protein